jgi:hypothetical protein
VGPTRTAAIGGQLHNAVAGVVYQAVLLTNNQQLGTTTLSPDGFFGFTVNTTGPFVVNVSGGDYSSSIAVPAVAKCPVASPSTTTTGSTPSPSSTTALAAVSPSSSTTGAVAVAANTLPPTASLAFTGSSTWQLVTWALGLLVLGALLITAVVRTVKVERQH